MEAREAIVTQSAAPTTDPIQALLDQRARFQNWLARLDAVGTQAPDAVRQRVRDDYKRRLDGVIEQLRGHASAIAATLTGLRTREAELKGEEGKIEEQLAEAELRHVVGEFDDQTWEQIRRDAGDRLEAVQGQLNAVRGEIARLVDVQAQIDAAPTPPPPGPEPVMVPRVETSTPTARAAAPAPQPAPAAKADSLPRLVEAGLPDPPGRPAAQPAE
ncbi:MAG: hypothetical protein ACOY71_13990, partial [Gemmatimonadota bacterium]